MLAPVDPRGGDAFARFCIEHCRHTKGRWARQAVVLEGWQVDFWREALEVDPATARRVYSEVGLGIPRKNGKSTVCACLCHFLAIADGEAEPEVYIAAAARNQAGVVLGQVRSMAHASPSLLDVERVLRYSIELPGNGGIIRSLSSDGALQHGLNPSGNVIDEIHAHKNGELYTALTTGTGAREQPFTHWVTTAGIAGENLLTSLLGQMHDGPGELEERNFVDGSACLLIYRDRANGVLIWWFGAPVGADIEDPRIWLASNPASWLQDGVYLRQQFERLKARGKLHEWRRYHLNQHLGVSESWLPPGAWDACKDETAQLVSSLPIGVGIDKSQHSDRSAVVIAQKQPLGGESFRIVVRSRVFAADEVTGRVNGAAIRQHLRDLFRDYPRPQARDAKTHMPRRGPVFHFDRWGFGDSAEMLEEDDGLHMVDFPQFASYMGPASTQAYELITNRRVIHDGDRELARHVANTTAVLTERGMKVTKPRKHNAAAPNDAGVALVMAIAAALSEAPPVRVSRGMRAA